MEKFATACCAAFFATALVASAAETSVDVRANIKGTCVIDQATPIDFGDLEQGTTAPDRITESMQVAIDETNRRRTIQEAYNREHGIVPQTIVKEIRDINDRLKAVGASPGSRDPGGDLSERSKEKVAKLVSQLEAEMRSAAKQLEFERAAAIRDEIQDIRLRVLDQDASTLVLKAAERARGVLRCR